MAMIITSIIEQIVADVVGDIDYQTGLKLVGMIEHEMKVQRMAIMAAILKNRTINDTLQELKNIGICNEAEVKEAIRQYVSSKKTGGDIDDGL